MNNRRLAGMVTVVERNPDIAILGQELLDRGCGGYQVVLGGNEFYLVIGSSHSISGVLDPDLEESIIRIWQDCDPREANDIGMVLQELNVSPTEYLLIAWYPTHE